MRDYKNSRLLVILILLLVGFESLAQQSAVPTGPEWLGQIDIYAKVIGGVLTALGALFGLPAAFLHFRKTRAEIRKLELEAEALAQETTGAQVSEYGHRIAIDGSHNSVTILADPRFLGPLLLLLDFIIAWVVLTLAGYALGTFLPGALRTLILGGIAAFLLVPIFHEARRVKSVLVPPEANGNEPT